MSTASLDAAFGALRQAEATRREHDERTESGLVGNIPEEIRQPAIEALELFGEAFAEHEEDCGRRPYDCLDALLGVASHSIAMGDGAEAFTAVGAFTCTYLDRRLYNFMSLAEYEPLLRCLLWLARFEDVIEPFQLGLAEEDFPWAAELWSGSGDSQLLLPSAFLERNFLGVIDPIVEDALRRAVASGRNEDWLALAATIRQRLDFGRAAEDMIRQLLVLWSVERGLVPGCPPVA